MPRSKRNKVISLTKTSSKGKDAKTQHIELLRTALDEYKNVFVLSFENMRTNSFRDIRAEFKESRIYLGKNSIAQVALGRTVEEEVRDNLRRVSEKLGPDTCLLFTNRAKKDVLKYFKSFSKEDLAKSGTISRATVVLSPGPIQAFSPYAVDHLRKLGPVLEIEDGKVFLRTQFTVATEGEALTAEQAKLLAYLKMPLSEFRVNVECFWSNGQFEEVAK